ncbi:hypothetical protein LBMAG21_03550 [Armatimonadota bacterium]|nr:hypothetical protein LBMAG21_03550 [Armatimonadota bacterium]
MRRRKSIANKADNASLLEIAPDGTLQFLWEDAFAPMLELGESTLCRASHVEPQGTEWVADLSPVGGPRLGAFPLRNDALSAERDWLQHYGFGRRVSSPSQNDTT